MSRQKKRGWNTKNEKKWKSKKREKTNVFSCSKIEISTTYILCTFVCQMENESKFYMRIKIAQCNIFGPRIYARLVLNFQNFHHEYSMHLFHNFSFVWCMFISAPSTCHRLIDFHCCYQHDGLYFFGFIFKKYFAAGIALKLQMHIYYTMSIDAFPSILLVHSIEKLPWKKNFYRFFVFYLF